MLEIRNAELESRIAERDRAIDTWRSCAASDANQILILQGMNGRLVGLHDSMKARHQAELRKISDLIFGIQVLLSQAVDTLCGSRWMNVAGLVKVLQRYWRASKCAERRWTFP